jgi:hypothetical protein
MAKKRINDLFAANPNAAAHREVIMKTLDAVKKLQDSGFGGSGYGLAPAYGGKILPSGKAQKREGSRLKMTYCA